MNNTRTKDHAADAPLIALVFAAMGVVGAREWDEDRLADLKRENARLRASTVCDQPSAPEAMRLPLAPMELKPAGQAGI